jgi:DNA invertase Pin-like site-specific DNA recombinase
MTRKIGYARVSTGEQSLDMQIDALEKEGCERIFKEHASGSIRDRKELNNALSTLKEGDTLVVWTLDRLGRDANLISNIVYIVNKNKIKLKSLKENLDPETALGRMIIGIQAHIGEVALERMTLNSKSGTEIARKKGIKFGRPKVTGMHPTVKAAKQLSKNTNMPRKEIALHLNIARCTLYKYLRIPDAS